MTANTISGPTLVFVAYCATAEQPTCHTGESKIFHVILLLFKDTVSRTGFIVMNDKRQEMK